MKKFNQLTVGDIFYSVYKDSMIYQTHEIDTITFKTITFKYNKSIPRFDESNGFDREYSRYNDGSKTYYFTNECDAIRFCKARMMKNIFRLIKKAEECIADIKDFRNEHFELLNHKWTEQQINKLENKLKL